MGVIWNLQAPVVELCWQEVHNVLLCAGSEWLHCLHEGCHPRALNHPGRQKWRAKQKIRSLEATPISGKTLSE